MIKRLETAQEIKRKEKRRQYTLAIVLIVVLFGSVFGIVVNSFGSSSSSQSNQIKYNGYTFGQAYGYYNLSLGSYNYFFTFLPNETATVPVLTNFSRKISSYSGKNVYIVYESYSQYLELSQNLNQYGERVQGACTSGEVCPDANLPVKDCTDNLIIVKNSTINKIYEDNNCIYIEGDKADLLKLTDEFLYRELDIK